nr:baculoviral IAP repeat-containing protein 7 isoform X4 [Desmodus rotundus]
MLAATIAPSRGQRAPAAALRAPWPLPNLGHLGGWTGSTLISQLLQAKATPAPRQGRVLSSPEASWLGTLQDWLSRVPVTAAELLRAGVPSMGPEERAQCWCCGPERSRWAAGGSPTGGHCGPCSLCGHVLGQDSDDTLWGGQDHMDGQILGQLRALVEEEEEDGAWAVPSSRPAFPEMGSEELRLASFCDWPPTTTVRPELLAAAGFFHTGRQDKVRCFFCSGGLQTWERGDDPWTEHAKWFPRCEFLLRTKGRDFVCSVQESLRHPLGSWLLPTPHPEKRPAQRVPGSQPPGAQDAEEQLRRLREERTCKVCLDRTVGIVFVPCGHLVCTMCAPSLQLCPICRAPIHSCVRTFLS